MCAGFLDCDWGYHDGQEKYTKLFKEDTILATAHVGHYQTIRDILQDDTDLYRSDDEFATVQKLASCGSAFALVAGQVRRTSAASHTAATLSLFCTAGRRVAAGACRVHAVRICAAAS